MGRQTLSGAGLGLSEKSFLSFNLNVSGKIDEAFKYFNIFP
jgi:hypothetical protein